MGIGYFLLALLWFLIIYLLRSFGMIEWSGAFNWHASGVWVAILPGLFTCSFYGFGRQPKVEVNTGEECNTLGQDFVILSIDEPREQEELQREVRTPTTDSG